MKTHYRLYSSLYENKIAYTQGLISYHYHDKHLHYKLQIKLFIQTESIYVKQFSQN
jgi:hypothetical protein